MSRQERLFETSTRLPAVPRPTADRRPPPPRPRPGGVLVDVLLRDWPLKALALVIAVTTWALVRQRLETDHTIPLVPVHVVDLPADVRLLYAEDLTASVHLVGMRAEVKSAEDRLKEEGLKFRLPGALPADEVKGSAGPYSSPRDFVFPFLTTEIVKDVSPTTISWVRVARKRVRVDRPEVRLASHEGWTVAPGSPIVDPQQVFLTAPVEIVEPLEFVAPDDVDPRGAFDDEPDLATFYTYRVRFDTWRGGDPLRAPHLAVFDPPEIVVKLKFRRANVPKSLVNRLRLLLPDSDGSTLRDYDVALQGGTWDAAARTVRAEVLGDAKTVEELERRPDLWSFVVAVPRPPELGAAAPRDVETPIRLEISPDFARASGIPSPVAEISGRPTLYVSLTSRR